MSIHFKLDFWVMGTSSNGVDPAAKKRFLVASACSCALMRA